MTKLTYIIDYLEKIFPSSLAEEWDNVGLLLGDRGRAVRKAMTCLTISQETAAEAIATGAELIISHHPFPFHAEKKWTSATIDGRILLTLLRNGIAVYSPHTAHDSAASGINEQLAQGLGLQRRTPLYPAVGNSTTGMYEGMTQAVPGFEIIPGAEYGTGRFGFLEPSVSLERFIEICAELLHVAVIPYAGDLTRSVHKVAIGCGAADDFLEQAAIRKADVFLTGEARFHSWVRADNESMALVAPGHFATERFAMERLARRLTAVFPGLDVTSATNEIDSVRWWTKASSETNI